MNGGRSYKDFEWEVYKAAIGNDQNSPDPGDPWFVGVADYRLTENSQALGIVTGSLSSGTTEADGNGDGKIGLEEAIHSLQKSR